MYIGHFAAGLLLKARVPEARLSWLLFGTAWLDLVSGVLMLCHLEYAVVHGTFVFSHLEAHIGYSHSLTATMAWSVVIGVLAARAARSRERVRLGYREHAGNKRIEVEIGVDRSR